jgi:uncharacterized tellurite resistance protein B-like protein
MALGPAQNERSAVNVFQQFTVAEKSPFDVNKLADKFRHRNTDWSIPEAFLGIMFRAAMADGTFEEAEIAAIQQVAARSRALKALSPQDLAATNNSVNEKLRTRGEGALKEACETLPADMCLPVFAHCVDIILADGQLQKSEAEFLQELAGMLDVTPENARRVMEVLLLKAQY